MARLWIGLLVFVPILPKVAVVYLGGTPIFLDDLALLLATAVAVGRLLLRSTVTGDARIPVSDVAPLFGLLLLYKIVDLSMLSLFLPWTDRWGIGRGVLLGEGIMVVAKSAVFFLAYVLFYAELRNTGIIRAVLLVFILSISVVVAVGAVQFFVFGHRSLTSTFRNIHVLVQPQAEGGFGLKNPWSAASGVGHEHLGAYAILSSCLLGGLLFCRWPQKAKLRALVVLLWLGCVFCLIFSSSRGAWIGGACALSVFAWLALREGRLERLLFLFLLVGGGLLVLKLGWDIDVIEFAEGRTAELFAMASGDVNDDSARNRLQLFDALWKTFLSSPMVGWGPGGAGRIAEGQWIRELVEGGILGAGLFTFIMVKMGRIALLSYRRSTIPMVQGVSVGFLCGLVGLLGQAFFTELFILTKIGTPFWLLAAVVHRLSALGRSPYPAV